MSTDSTGSRRSSGDPHAELLRELHLKLSRIIFEGTFCLSECGNVFLSDELDTKTLREVLANLNKAASKCFHAATVVGCLLSEHSFRLIIERINDGQMTKEELARILVGLTPQGGEV